jgi:hypothetical protein
MKSIPILPFIHIPAPAAEPYIPDPRSAWRVKLAFRVDFINGGHVEGQDFLLDIPGPDLAIERAAEILVLSMNLLRAGSVTIRSMHIVRRGEYDDL